MRKDPDRLAQVLRDGLCVGCGACAALAPQQVRMQQNAAGFLRPQGALQDLPEPVAQICPGLDQSLPAPFANGHPLWGRSVASHVVHARDADIRFTAASGGGLTGFASWLLRNGHVDGVLATGASAHDPMANEARVARDATALRACAGSRYQGSTPLSLVPECAATGQRYAFIGKPCDVSALRRWMRQDPALGATFPVVLSFFCAGVPSAKGAQEILNTLGVAPETLASFRYRGHGWPGRAVARTHEGQDASMSYAQSWGDILSKHVQHRCKLCTDGVGLEADVAFADCWETDARGYPVFDERPGESLALCRTPIGAKLLQAAIADGALAARGFDMAGLDAIQPGQVRRKSVLRARLAALRLIGRAVPRSTGHDLGAAARHARLRVQVRNFLGMLRRGWRLQSGS